MHRVIEANFAMEDKRKTRLMAFITIFKTYYGQLLQTWRALYESFVVEFDSQAEDHISYSITEQCAAYTHLVKHNRENDKAIRRQPKNHFNDEI